MRNDVVHEQVASLYADGVDHVWSTWEPSLRSCERILANSARRHAMAADDVASQLRRVQYHAHLAGELSIGLVPPIEHASRHGSLVTSLELCRDTLGVLAVRAELDELDDETTVIGLLAADATRDAFLGARSTPAAVNAWIASDGVAPDWVSPAHPPSRVMTVLMWSLVVVCAVLFVALVAEVFLITPGA
jgi:hypothetical protein